MKDEAGVRLERSGPARRFQPLHRSAPVELVWFKRDLRIHDHEPLVRAAEAGPVLCLFIHEPELQTSPEFDHSHLIFLQEALAELSQNLTRQGGRLLQCTGAAVDVFERLRREVDIAALWSHEETGNAITYRRDLAVARWCHDRGIPWNEFRQDGVVRRLRNRNGWAERWNRTMHLPILEPPLLRVPAMIPAGDLPPTASSLGLEMSIKPWAQRGGESTAINTLDAFLAGRGREYRSAMSSPLTGWQACSRISPYLAWGCLSMKATVDTLENAILVRREAVLCGAPVDKTWNASLRSFASRLRWHCHFMQKLEDEPRLEFENMAHACDGLREEFTDSAAGKERLAAWKEGLTGYPMVDACMRAVQATGWLNFRMRAMLMSFASHHLWLHWRPTAVFLAKHFLDFEPGIHFSQAQMQSGTTGINTVRIYSPAKQALDQDPDGRFIKMWVPELEGIPASWLAEPHKMPAAQQIAAGCRIGRDYPAPIVDHATAYRDARAKLAALRRRPESRKEAKNVFLKHGSRKRRQPVEQDPQLPLWG
jgi:deoxyribodipyrimidine photo-lyase